MNTSPFINILLVEDDEDDYIIIKNYLSKSFIQYEITWANNFDTFLSYLDHFPFHLVITDYLLGNTSGIEVLKRVKDKDSLLPVIMLTGKGNSAIDVEAMKQGASDYLIKGNFDASSIERSVRYALERAQSMKILQENESYQNTLNKIVSTGRIARMIAHEVKNPLTNIMLCAEHLKEILEGNEEVSSYTEIIERNSNRINQLVSNLLDSTRFGDMNLQRLNLIEVVKNTIGLARDRIHLKSIQLNETYSHPSVELDLDPEKIKIALLNIIINAVEVLEESKGVIHLKVLKEKHHVHIHIVDNGPGMSEETKEKLFEPFFSSKPNGSGLGLTSSQNIILSHKGKIDVRSELNQGAEFIISFPC